MARRENIEIHRFDLRETRSNVRCNRQEIMKGHCSRRRDIDYESDSLGRKPADDHIVAMAETEMVQFNGPAAQRQIELVSEGDVGHCGGASLPDDVALGFLLGDDRRLVGEGSPSGVTMMTE